MDEEEKEIFINSNQKLGINTIDKVFIYIYIYYSIKKRFQD